MRCVLIVVLLMLAGCATAPSRVSNACAIFSEKDGLFGNWRRAAVKAERQYGVPVPILLATIYAESGFRPYARPPRTKLLGFIPWKRPSSAYGYAQAIDGTWETYKRSTGRWSASRTNFGDAVHFVAWYHRLSHQKNGIALNDPYRLYLAYHSGQEGYDRGAYRARPEAMSGARRTAQQAQRYAAQLQRCR